MKKYFSLMAGFILLAFMACQNDELVNGGDGSETTASFSIQLPDGGSSVTTRANSGAGDGAMVNRCIMEVYKADGERYLRKVVAVSEKKVQFEVRLVTSQTYDFVFWADHVTSTENDNINTDLHYATNSVNGLQAISLQGIYEGSSKDDSRDAFFAKEKSVTVTGAFSKKISLSRPFGQLNIKTNDIDDIKSDKLKPATASLAFSKVYKSFNALTGETIGEVGTINYNSPAAVVDAQGFLTVDYLFAPATDKVLADVVLKVHDGDGKEITGRDLQPVPVKRNYKTNVSGALLTAGGSFDVSVVPDFVKPDIDENLVETRNITDAITALQEGKTNIKIVEAPVVETTLTLPKYTNKNDVAVAITLPPTEKKITIEVNSQTGTGGNPPAELHITTSSAGEMEINTPETTVTLNGERYAKVNASTASNTLIVESGVEIDSLNLKKGNVKLYGKVGIVTRDKECPAGQGIITRCLDNQMSFDNLIADVTSGYTGILIEREAIFDAAKVAANASATVGKPMKIAANATISNLKIHVTQAAISPIEIVDGAGNVTFDNLTVSSTNEYSLVKVLGTNQKVTIRNSALLLTSGKSGQSGFNIQNGGSNNVITALLDNTYIGFGSTKLNVSKEQDYTYTDEKKNAFKGSSYSRAITTGTNSNKVYDGTATTNLTVNNCVFEGVYYVINTLHNVSLNVNVDNSILDGRAAFNIWSTAMAGSVFNIKDSKLIGRNSFSGPTEVFATVVLNDYNDNDAAAVKYVRNNTIILDNCDVVSDNAPQTETNYQYGVSMRSPYYNKLILKKNTKFRETQTPRLPHAVDIDTNAWRNEVVTDGSVNLDGCAAGATVLPSNQWSGNSYASVGTGYVADDGKIYIGAPDVLAGFIQDGGNGNGVEVVLVRDLDMGSHKLELRGSYSEAISNCIFNGNNHTIANYKMENAMYAGLFPNAITVTIKNLTLKNANVKALNDSKNNAYAGGFIGRAYGTNVVENCTLENSTVQGINKVGGIIGFQAENGICVRNCTVKGSTVKVDTGNEQYGQCGGIIGYIGVGTAINEISGNFVVNTKVEAPFNVNAGHEHRKSSICVGVLQGEAGQSLIINMPLHCVDGSTFNGKAIDKTDYQGLLGGVRYPENKSSVTINGTKY